MTVISWPLSAANDSDWIDLPFSNQGSASKLLLIPDDTEDSEQEINKVATRSKDPKKTWILYISTISVRKKNRRE